MEVLILTTFVSVLLATGGALLFVWSARAGTLDHADRLALLPLAEDQGSEPKTSPVHRAPHGAQGAEKR